jgi:hypothetical protein
MASALAALVRAASGGVDHRRRAWYAGLALVAVFGMIGLDVIGVSASAQAAGPAWSVVPSPEPQQLVNGAFNGVSCASASFCMGVGYYESSDGNVAGTLTESWNGSSWSIVASGNADGGSKSSLLYGVSCVSASFCAAVGEYDRGPGGGDDDPLVEMWNGSGWTGVAVLPTIGRLTGVSCVSATSCIAVGYSVDFSTGLKQTLVESWNGTSWGQVGSPDPGTSDNVLAGVSCLSATSCIAVGSQTASNQQTLVESWDGTAWSVVPSPSRPGTSGLDGISCVSASSCTAVGSSTATAKAVSKTLIETWNGSTWSIVPSPNNSSGQPNYLSSVSCPTATFCVAGGSQAQVWDGSTWSIVYSLGGYSGAGLSGVSCPSASSCLVAGWSRDSNKIPHTVAYVWDGTAWAAAPAPQHQVLEDTLSGVTCQSASFCTAVGFHTSGPFSHELTQTLAESWNGSTWSVVPSPSHFQNGAENYSALGAVSCLSASSCTAVGNWEADAADNDAEQSLVESWDGSAWSLVTSPDKGTFTDGNDLTGVSCVSASFCTAVGFYFPNGLNNEAKTLVETWNGTKWSVVPSPVDGVESSLASVSCVSASSCTAVGSFVASEGDGPGPLAESWNGSTWSIVLDSPNVGSLSGVSCVSASSCTAVGSSGTNRSTLIESWDGTTWSVVTSPNSGSGDNELDSVSCVSATSCTAVGSSSAEDNLIATSTLVESWDGTTWSVATSPDGPAIPPGTQEGPNDLLGVSCLAASCTAVGDYRSADPENNQYTLIESNA